MALSHRNIQGGICDADGYDMRTIQKHLPFCPCKASEACEALTTLRSGSESNTARSFLRRPGRVLHQKLRSSRKTGKEKRYEAQPIYTYTDPASGKQKSRRIPKAAFARVKGLTERYQGLKGLLRRLDAAAVAENLDGDSKKNSSR